MRKIKQLLSALTLSFALIITSAIIAPQSFSSTTVQAATPKLSKTSLSLTVGCNYTLKITGTTQKVSWSTSNASIATVSSTGKVISKKEGAATITAKVAGKKYTCKVTVKGNYKKLYKEFLENGKINYTIGNSTCTDTIGSFYLIDVDKNGVPELIAKSGAASDTFSRHHILTVRSGKVFSCGNHYVKGDSGFYYNSTYKSIFTWWWTNGVGGSGAQLIRVSGGKIVPYKYAWEGSVSMGSSNRVYYIGTSSDSSKQVSKNTYLSFCKKYLKAPAKRSFIPNTQSNRIAKFGK